MTEPTVPKREKLVAALQEARKKRLVEETGKDSFENQEELYNKCLRNAYVLKSTLQEHGFAPVVICGGITEQPIGIDGIRRSSLPTTIRECRDEGMIHYWVETNLRTYTLDLAAEFPDGHPSQGNPFIARSVPANYYYLENGIDYTFNRTPK